MKDHCFFTVTPLIHNQQTEDKDGRNFGVGRFNLHTLMAQIFL